MSAPGLTAILLHPLTALVVKYRATRNAPDQLSAFVRSTYNFKSEQIAVPLFIFGMDFQCQLPSGAAEFLKGLRTSSADYDLSPTEHVSF